MAINIDKLKGFYRALPPTARSAFGFVPPPHRFSMAYYKWRKIIARCMSDAEYLEGFRRDQLKRVLFSAIDRVPWYQNAIDCSNSMRKLVLTDPFRALKEFPVINRDYLSQFSNQFRDSSVSARRTYTATTGGTSGKPVSIQLTNTSWGAEWAFVFDLLARHGIRDTDRRLSLRGVRFGESRDPFEYNPTYRELRISPFHLSESYVETLLSEIIKYSPKYILGYPTAISGLLDLMGRNSSYFLSSIKVVLCVSEGLPGHLVRKIASQTDANVCSFYGLSERVSFIERNSQGFWVPNETYGVTEFLNGRIVATGFINEAMPLIRYDTGDTVDIDEGGQVKNIRGRWNHAELMSRTGGKISMTALNVHDMKFSEAGEFQLIQEHPGEVLMCYNKALRKTEIEATARMAEDFSRKCAGEIVFKPTPVDRFELTPVGKKPLVVIKKR